MGETKRQAASEGRGEKPRRRIAVEVLFANGSRRRLYPALHPSLPLEEQLEALKGFLLEAMTAQQAFSLEVEGDNGRPRLEILNQQQVNALDVFLAAAEEPRAAREGGA